MHIEHIALFTRDLDRSRDFYVEYFGGTPGTRYENPANGFSSFFLTFDSGARLEIMHMNSIPESLDDPMKQFTGIIHLAFKVDGKESVDRLTERLRADGFKVVGEPRTTGDGYYESVVLDPDGNRVELVG